MPLSEPSDSNPIVKEPPVFGDGTALPSSTSESNINLNGTMGTDDLLYMVYDNGADELFAGEQPTIYVFDGFSATSKRTMTGPAVIRNLAVTSNFLYVVTGGGLESISELDKSDASVQQTLDFSSIAGSSIDGIAFKNGNLYLVDNTQTVYVFDGFSTTQTDSVDFSGQISGSIGSIAWVGNWFCILDTTNDEVKVFDGFTTSVLATVDVPSGVVDQAISEIIDDEKSKLLIGGNNTSSEPVVNKMRNEDNGQNFTGNSGKTLEAGKIYSFEITGPNTITNPTLNDDGQGEFPIQLPGGASIPVGALAGQFDFAFNGSVYTIVTITAAMAKSIYDFQDAVKDNMTATTDPGTGDDEDAGYSIRSRWYNTSSGEAFLCVDASAGAAVWVKASLTLDELGSAATEDVGTTVGDVAQFEDVGGGTPGYPAVDGSQITNLSGLQKPGSSIDPGLGFDTWRTPNANRPTLVTVAAQAGTGGGTNGDIEYSVDESGGTTPDYTETIAWAEANNTNGAGSNHTVSTFLVPAGGSYMISNTATDSANTLHGIREFTL